MPIFSVWDLIKVPFPYTNRPVLQRRPALIVATPDAPGELGLLWVLMVTSAANRHWPRDVPISDDPVSGLPALSVVRVAKIATIESADAQPLGSLPSRDRAPVRRALRAWLTSCFGALEPPP